LSRLAQSSISLAVTRQKTSFHVCRLYSGEKLFGHVVYVFETNGGTKRSYALRDGLFLAVFPTREEAIAAADALYSR
jgi:hypothetical protein